MTRCIEPRSKGSRRPQSVPSRAAWRLRRMLACGMALTMLTAAGCVERQPPNEARADAWIGKSQADVAAKYGQPTQYIPLIETEGNVLIYDNPNQPHFVFETDPNGIITKATVIK